MSVWINLLIYDHLGALSTAQLRLGPTLRFDGLRGGHCPDDEDGLELMTGRFAQVCSSYNHRLAHRLAKACYHTAAMRVSEHVLFPDYCPPVASEGVG